jgi:predicted methyltransferase
MASRRRRYKLLQERYPYAEYLRFGIIGDDDLFSSCFIDDYWAWPVIIEKDRRLAQQLTELSPRFDVRRMDVKQVPTRQFTKTVETFIADPPYTFHGALAFIIAGLSILETQNEHEFYVILNQTMMGSSLARLQKVMSLVGISLIEARPNFSQYALPEKYAELRRARRFETDQSLNMGKIRNSSSSDLFIFQCYRPNWRRLLRYIDYSKLYSHFT